jgi:photosystem II stability/assembly factor-like uncharacterized protein
MKINTICIFSIWILSILMGCSLDNNITEKSILDEIEWQPVFIDSQSVDFVAGAPDGKLYATIGFNGLFFSEDKGSTWQKPSILNYGIADMAFSPEGNIYATLRAPLDVGGVLRSADGGLTWQDISQPASVPLSIVFHPSGAILFGAGSLGYAFEGAVYKTENDFGTFAKTSFPDTIAIYTMRISNTGDIFAGTARGVYKSSDIGETWNAVNNGLIKMNESIQKTGIYLLEINQANNHIYAFRYTALYKTEDNGNNWSITGLADMDYTYSIVINKDGVIFADAWHTTLEHGVYYSLDDGDTWTKIDKEILLPSIWSLTIDTEGYLYAGTQYGLYRTDKSTIK